MVDLAEISNQNPLPEDQGLKDAWGIPHDILQDHRMQLKEDRAELIEDAIQARIEAARYTTAVWQIEQATAPITAKLGQDIIKAYVQSVIPLVLLRAPGHIEELRDFVSEQVAATAYSEIKEQKFYRIEYEYPDQKGFAMKCFEAEVIRAKGEAYRVKEAALATSVNLKAQGSPTTSPEEFEVSDDIEFIKLEGGGASARVWQAREKSLDRMVAIRLLIGADQKAIAHAKTLAKAKHANVVVVHYLRRISHPDTHTMELGIILEFIDGQNLGKLIKSKVLPKADVIRIANALFAGIRHLHEIDLPHGDLHEGNVRVNEQVVKILDLVNEEEALSTLSLANRKDRDLRALWRILVEVLCSSELNQSVVTLKLAKAPNIESLDVMQSNFNFIVEEAGSQKEQASEGASTGRLVGLKPERLCSKIRTKIQDLSTLYEWMKQWTATSVQDGILRGKQPREVDLSFIPDEGSEHEEVNALIEKAKSMAESWNTHLRGQTTPAYFQQVWAVKRIGACLVAALRCQRKCDGKTDPYLDRCYFDSYIHHDIGDKSPWDA